MAIIANLAVAVTARTTKFNKEMTTTRRRVQALGASVRQVGIAAGVAFAAMGAAASLMVRHFMRVGDEASKMAQRTGLSVRAITQLDYIAKITGTDIGAVEKGIKKMARTIVDAEAGLMTYVRAFDRIGLAAEDLINMTPEEAFFNIAEAIAAVENPIIRAATAAEVFGRAGTMLLPMFQAGEKGIIALRREADMLGATFGEETAAKAVLLTDQITRLKTAASGLAIAFGETIAPAISAVAETIITRFQSIRAFVVTAFSEIGIEGMRWYTGMLKVADGMKWGFHIAADSIQAAFRSALAWIVEAFENMVRDAQRGLNVIIEALNKIPKVEIEKIILFETDLDERLKGAAGVYARAASESIGEMNAAFARRENEFLAFVERTRTRTAALIAGNAAVVAKQAQTVEQLAQTTTAAKLPAALEKGTTAAYSAIVQAKYGAQERAVERTADNTAQANTKLDENNRLLGEIAGNRPEVVGI